MDNTTEDRPVSTPGRETPKEVDHQLRTSGGEYFSCHAGANPHVQIGNEEVPVADLLEIANHVRACALCAGSGAALE